MSKIDWAALGNLMSTATLANAPMGSPAQLYAQEMNERFRAQQIQQAQKKAEKERKKKEQSGLLGKLGATLGTLGGAALAPATGGASLAIPALTGAAGGAIGQAAGGGGFDAGSIAGYGAQGLMGGYGASAYNPANNAQAPDIDADVSAMLGSLEGPHTKPAPLKIPYGTKLTGALQAMGGDMLGMGGGFFNQYMSNSMGGAALPKMEMVYDDYGNPIGRYYR